MSINDAKHNALSSALSAAGHIDDLEYLWLESVGAPPGQVQDMWSDYMISLGYTDGNLQDKLFAWTGDKGFTGSLSDRMYQLWLSGDIGGGGPPPSGDAPFSVDLYLTGNVDIVNGLNLADDGGLVWIKQRDGGLTDHYVISSRDITKQIRTNESLAEGNASAFITSFNTDGFGAGGSPSGNKAAFTFKQQSKFLDIVTYTGNGTLQTIPHNLGGEVGMILVKRLDASSNWAVYARGLGATRYLQLNNTSNAGTSSSYWNDTEPTNTEFTVASSTLTNRNGNLYVAHVFGHEVSGNIQSGEYTGNGGTLDIDLGVDVQWVIVKPASFTGNWEMYDTTRGPSQVLYPNLDSTEGASSRLAFIENGIRVSSTLSANGQQYIYMAIKAGTT